MLFPKKVKYRKWQTRRSNPKKARVAGRGIDVSFGSFGLQAMQPGRITSQQIEAARKASRRALGKTGKMWIRIFPDQPYTRKAAEVPMGKGKGTPEGFMIEVQPGRMLFEVDGVAADVAREALRKGGTKLPVRTKFVER